MNEANLSKYLLRKQHLAMKTTLTVSPKLGHCKWQSINCHACTYAASDRTAQNIFSSNGTEKLCSINHAIILSTDAGHLISNMSK